MKPRIMSGVQPTGNLHLGNYLGAIKQWVALQHTHECLFCIVDLHAITIPQDPAYLRQSTYDTTALYVACGIDPSKAIIFNQSTVPQHGELAWILGCMTPLGWLNRMTQFKEKAGKHKEQSGLGLYSYPVLMAADILLYHATHVPVGEDQKQHLELARDIAGSFNHRYGKEYFTLPEPLILGEATRVMGLRDGTKKMSKSDSSDFSRIHLTDTPDIIAAKIKKAKSDMLEGITYDETNRPEASNFLNIYIALTGEKREKVYEQFHSYGFSDFKQRLIEVLVSELSPIRERFEILHREQHYLNSLLASGAERAMTIAGKTMKHVKEIIGLVHATA